MIKAFPVTSKAEHKFLGLDEDDNPKFELNKPEVQELGMDLRDYFAIRSPKPGSVTWGEIIKFKGLKQGTDIRYWEDEYTLEWECAERYKFADAMLKAREAKK